MVGRSEAVTQDEKGVREQGRHDDGLNVCREFVAVRMFKPGCKDRDYNGKLGGEAGWRSKGVSKGSCVFAVNSWCASTDVVAEERGNEERRTSGGPTDSEWTDGQDRQDRQTTGFAIAL